MKVEARIIPGNSVLSCVWSPELAEALDAWERAVELGAQTARADVPHAAVLESAELRIEQARVAFVVRLAMEMLGHGG